MAAFRSLWVVKLLNGKLNPILTSVLQAATELYSARAETDINLWESRIDHSANIVKHIQSPTLAMLQANWATVIRREPTFKVGDWVAYSNEEEPNMRFRDKVYKGRAILTAIPTDGGDEIVGDWYEWDPPSAKYVLQPPQEGEAWHFPIKKCFLINKASLVVQETEIAPPLPDQLYMVTASNITNGDKSKSRVSDILVDEEEPRPLEKFGPAFIKRNTNSKLASAQLLRADTTNIKVNKWVSTYGIELSELHGMYQKTFCASKIKGFMWLFISHALPVGDRMRGKDAKKMCPRCGLVPETIKHMAHGCKWAKEVKTAAMLEWQVRTGGPVENAILTFAQAFLTTCGNSTLETAKATLSAIILHHIWKDRCNMLYNNGGSIPVTVTANNIWVEFESSILARIKHYSSKRSWWSAREYANLVPRELANQNIVGIEAECNTLAALLPFWSTPKPNTAAAAAIRDDWTGPKVETEDFIPFNDLPLLYPRWGTKWRLSSAPQPNIGRIRGRNNSTLDAGSSSYGSDEESRNSASESGD